MMRDEKNPVSESGEIESEAVLRRTLPHSLWQAMRRRKGVFAGAILIAILALAALLAPVLAPHDPYLQDIGKGLIPPVWHSEGTWEHMLGTDRLGRDYLSRLIYGARISLLIGALSALVSGIIGTTLGLLAGYFGGRVDMVISYVIMTRLAMPVIVIALALGALLGGSLMMVITVIGLLLWDRFAIVARAATQQVRDQEFVAAARSAGIPTWQILLKEVLPNIANPIIVVATLEAGHAILLEAGLSFLGLGVQPPVPSWGLMIAEGKKYMIFSPWVISIPGIALATLVLAIYLLGDGLRDWISPGVLEDDR